MDHSGYLGALAAGFARLRTVATGDLTAAVPTCPGWDAADLTRHVGEVYLHKTLAMREGAEPEPWPPAELAAEEPLALLDRAYAGLLAEFASRDPRDAAGSWYAPDQTVGFWIRRMAHETVIHRIDAELAAGQPLAPVPDDLAADGIDELLKVFVAYGVAEWGEYFTGILDGSPGRTFLIRADATDGKAADARPARAWRVRTGPGLFEVEDVRAASEATSDVTLSGPPAEVLRHLWNREDETHPARVHVRGPREAAEELRHCVVTATQ